MEERGFSRLLVFWDFISARVFILTFVLLFAFGTGEALIADPAPALERYDAGLFESDLVEIDGSDAPSSSVGRLRTSIEFSEFSTFSMDPTISTSYDRQAESVPYAYRLVSNSRDGDVLFANQPVDQRITGTGEIPKIPDPIEPFNRTMFTVNDWAYFNMLKPVAQGYKFVTHRYFRRGVRSVFDNLDEPDDFINSLLQFRLLDAGRSLSRLVINSTAGIGGLFDPASRLVDPANRNFNQTFGKWGVGPGMYLMVPGRGPTSARGVAGSVAGGFTDPVNYVRGEDSTAIIAGINIVKMVNALSFQIGRYERMKESALDPYSVVKDAHEQKVHNQIQN